VSQRLNSYLAASQELRKFARKTHELAALQRQYRQLAPPTLAKASQVIGFERQILIIGASNSTIAAKLRQLIPQFVRLFQGAGAEVTGIRITVQVASPLRTRKSPDYSLSVAGKQHLADCAASMADSPLKDALQRLANVRKFKS
jgi:hypothetical protein